MLPIIPIYLGVTMITGYALTKAWNHSRFGEWIRVRPVVGTIAAPILASFTAIRLAVTITKETVITISGKRKCRMLNGEKFNWELR